MKHGTGAVRAVFFINLFLGTINPLVAMDWKSYGTQICSAITQQVLENPVVACVVGAGVITGSYLLANSKTPLGYEDSLRVDFLLRALDKLANPKAIQDSREWLVNQPAVRVEKGLAVAASGNLYMALRDEILSVAKLLKIEKDINEFLKIFENPQQRADISRKEASEFLKKKILPLFENIPADYQVTSKIAHFKKMLDSLANPRRPQDFPEWLKKRPYVESKDGKLVQSTKNLYEATIEGIQYMAKDFGIEDQVNEFIKILENPQQNPDIARKQAQEYLKDKIFVLFDKMPANLGPISERTPQGPLQGPGIFDKDRLLRKIDNIQKVVFAGGKVSGDPEIAKLVSEAKWLAAPSRTYNGLVANLEAGINTYLAAPKGQQREQSRVNLAGSFDNIRKHAVSHMG